MREQIQLSLLAQAEEESQRSGEIGSPTTFPATVTRVKEMKALTRQVCNYRVNTWSNNRDGHRHTQVGSLYMERTAKGRGYYTQRWVAELNISGCRYRMRSHSYEKCWAWIQNIREIYRQLKTDLNLRPIHHKKDDSSDAHLFLGLLSYWIVNTIRYKLKQTGETCYWTEVVRRLSTQKAVTTEATNALGEKIHMRLCSEPNKSANDIYERLKYKKMPFRKIKIERSL